MFCCKMGCCEDMNKNDLRHAMKRLNLLLPEEQKQAAAERIFADIEALSVFQKARCVACFCALPDEPPTEAVLRRWSLERRVVVPRVEGDTMRFYDYRPDALVRGAFGIAEPVVAEDSAAAGSFGVGGATDADAPEPCRTPLEACALCPPEAIDLLVVPGVAFTREGARLGRGKGYYDRYLAQDEVHAYCVGVCFAHQLVDELPVEPHDRAMDAVRFG